MIAFVRIFFINFEFLIFLIGIGVYYFGEEYINIKLNHISFDPHIFNYLSMIPCAIFLWIFNKGSSFLQRDTENHKILVQWDKYAYMKKIFIVGFIYAIIAVATCVLSALTYKHSAAYIIAFISGLLVLITVAISFYFANGNIKDILAMYNN